MLMTDTQLRSEIAAQLGLAARITAHQQAARYGEARTAEGVLAWHTSTDVLVWGVVGNATIFATIRTAVDAAPEGTPNVVADAVAAISDSDMLFAVSASVRSHYGLA